MTIYATIMLFVYPFGTPAFFSYLLWYRHRPELKELQRREGRARAHTQLRRLEKAPGKVQVRMTGTYKDAASSKNLIEQARKAEKAWGRPVPTTAVESTTVGTPPAAEGPNTSDSNTSGRSNASGPRPTDVPPGSGPAQLDLVEEIEAEFASLAPTSRDGADEEVTCVDVDGPGGPASTPPPSPPPGHPPSDGAADAPVVPRPARRANPWGKIQGDAAAKGKAAAQSKAMLLSLHTDATDEKAVQQLARDGRLPEHVKKLIQGYELRVYWFEVFECLRKLALIGVPVFFDAGSFNQLAYGLIVAFVTFGAYMLFAPYTNEDDDLLAQLCQGQTFFSLVAAMLLISGDKGLGGRNLDVLLVVCTTAPVLFGFVAYFTENTNKRAAMLKQVATIRAKAAVVREKLGWGHPKVRPGSNASNGPREAASTNRFAQSLVGVVPAKIAPAKGGQSSWPGRAPAGRALRPS